MNLTIKKKHLRYRVHYHYLSKQNNTLITDCIFISPLLMVKLGRAKKGITWSNETPFTNKNTECVTCPKQTAATAAILRVMVINEAQSVYAHLGRGLSACSDQKQPCVRLCWWGLDASGTRVTMKSKKSNLRNRSISQNTKQQFIILWGRIELWKAIILWKVNSGGQVAYYWSQQQLVGHLIAVDPTFFIF